MPRLEPSHTPPRRRSGEAVLAAVGFLSFFDRFSLAAMLVVMAAQESITVPDAAGMLAAYSLAYALGQPLWGLLGDVIGRVRTLEVALAGTVLASAATVIAPTTATIVIARVACGFFVGAMFPTVLTVVGDTVSAGAERGRAVAALQTATALGTTVATVGAAAIASATNWRAVPGLVLVAATILFVIVRRMPRRPRTSSAAPRRLRSAFRRWPLTIYAIAAVEGALLLGVFSFLAPAVERAGVPAAVAGVFVGGYGVAIVAFAQATRRLLRVWTRTSIMLWGAVALTAAYGLAATGSVIALAVAAALVGASNALLHSSLQSWATEVSPDARATTVSLFACALFLGAGVATAVVAAVAAEGYGAVFAVAACGAAVLGAASVVAFRAWGRVSPAGKRPAV